MTSTLPHPASNVLPSITTGQRTELTAAVSYTEVRRAGGAGHSERLEMRQSRPQRLLRGLASSAIATFVALLSHVSAGGDMPAWVGIAVPWVFAMALCTLLAGRRLSVVRLSISVVVSQVLFHTLFVLGSVSSGSDAAQVHEAHLPTAHLHGALALTPSAGGEVPAMAGMMWLGHAAAAVLTIVALYAGERTLRALRTIATRLAAWLRRRLSSMPPVLAAPARQILSAWRAPSIVRDVSATPVSRRGPPLSLAV